MHETHHTKEIQAIKGREYEPMREAVEHTGSTVCVVGTESTKGAAGIVVGLAEATTTKTAASKGHFEGRRSRYGEL